MKRVHRMNEHTTHLGCLSHVEVDVNAAHLSTRLIGNDGAWRIIASWCNLSNWLGNNERWDESTSGGWALNDGTHILVLWVDGNAKEFNIKFLNLKIKGYILIFIYLLYHELTRKNFYLFSFPIIGELLFNPLFCSNRRNNKVVVTRN